MLNTHKATAHCCEIGSRFEHCESTIEPLAVGEGIRFTS